MFTRPPERVGAEIVGAKSVIPAFSSRGRLNAIGKRTTKSCASSVEKPALDNSAAIDLSSRSAPFDKSSTAWSNRARSILVLLRGRGLDREIKGERGAFADTV